MDEFEDAHLAECERDLDELEVRRPYEVVESEYFARIHRNYDIEKLKIEHEYLQCQIEFRGETCDHLILDKYHLQRMNLQLEKHLDLVKQTTKASTKLFKLTVQLTFEVFELIEEVEAKRHGDFDGYMAEKEQCMASLDKLLKGKPYVPEFEEAEDELRREMDGDWDEKFKIAEEAEKKAEDRCEIMTKRLEAIVRNMEQKLVAHEVELQHLLIPNELSNSETDNEDMLLPVHQPAQNSDQQQMEVAKTVTEDVAMPAQLDNQSFALLHQEDDEDSSSYEFGPKPIPFGSQAGALSKSRNTVLSSGAKTKATEPHTPAIKDHELRAALNKNVEPRLVTPQRRGSDTTEYPNDTPTSMSETSERTSAEKRKYAQVEHASSVKKKLKLDQVRMMPGEAYPKQKRQRDDRSYFGDEPQRSDDGMKTAKLMAPKQIILKEKGPTSATVDRESDGSSSSRGSKRHGPVLNTSLQSDRAYNLKEITPPRGRERDESSKISEVSSTDVLQSARTPKTTAKANVPPSGPSVAPEQRKNASPMAQTGPSGPTDSFAEDFSFMGFDSDSDYPSQTCKTTPKPNVAQSGAKRDPRKKAISMAQAGPSSRAIQFADNHSYAISDGHPSYDSDDRSEFSLSNFENSRNAHNGSFGSFGSFEDLAPQAVKGRSDSADAQSKKTSTAFDKPGNSAGDQPFIEFDRFKKKDNEELYRSEFKNSRSSHDGLFDRFEGSFGSFEDLARKAFKGDPSAAQSKNTFDKPGTAGVQSSMDSDQRKKKGDQKSFEDSLSGFSIVDWNGASESASTKKSEDDNGFAFPENEAYDEGEGEGFNMEDFDGDDLEE